VLSVPGLSNRRFPPRTIPIGAATQAGFGALVAAFLVLVAMRGLAQAEEPKIYLIELFSTNQVLLHFNTDANRTYTVQFLDLDWSNPKPVAPASRKSSPAKWTNLTVVPAIPFANHYIIVDTRTTHARIYRLVAEP